jgi:hypothetical protein
LSLGTKDLRHPSPRVVTMCDGGHSANAHDYGAASTLRNTWPDICNLFQGYVSLDRQGHISFNNARKVNYSVQRTTSRCHSSPIKFISRFATNSRYVHFESSTSRKPTGEPLLGSHLALSCIALPFESVRSHQAGLGSHLTNSRCTHSTLSPLRSEKGLDKAEVIPHSSIQFNGVL